MKKAIFVDRDGVLIKAPVIDGKPKSIKKLKHCKIIPGVISGLKLLKENFIIIMITNQPDVSRKSIKKKNVKKINSFLKKKLQIDDIFVCYHDNFHKCSCRKPKPGMILLAKKKWKIDLKQSYLVGDRASDIVAGKKVGCTNFFINYGYNEKLPSKNDCFYVKSFCAAALKIEKILKEKKHH